ncbi:hypothetical protein NC653_035013 [Populus alba x Populus x berolinensis]|uniref:Uncharacterized protein n=1 Tax=Populus alba x Populus x berolinensis TaxID=444605 RepID=A0AAD6LP19_9ROSI|nr:hypothetical protein NC653_035013 [Populus alba x Populus x berolinensis]
MKKKTEHEEDEHKRDLEILKAVAQAWHGHSGSSRSTNEYDAYRQNFQSKPSRFKLEAMNKSSAKRVESVSWDFKQSLWDSYEIVNVSKRLERELVLEDPFSGLDTHRRVYSKKRESKKSLRNLFNLMSSRRFNEAEIPCKEFQLLTTQRHHNLIAALQQPDDCTEIRTSSEDRLSSSVSSITSKS